MVEYPRALSMPGVNMNAAIKKAVQDAVDAGETEKAQRIVLDVLGAAFAADAAQFVVMPPESSTLFGLPIVEVDDLGDASGIVLGPPLI